MPARLKIAFAHLALLLCGAWSGFDLWAQQSTDSGSESVAIGLLVEDSLWVEGRYGAEFAVKEINRRGGLHGRQLVLSVKSMEGPWGVGSSRTVDLVFEQKVCALVGLLKGRNSHLVEQVAAKTNVPFISAWAADPTLSKAYVPQFFNCVPNSEQQGRILLSDLKVKNGFETWFLVSDDDYDSRISVQGLNQLETYEKSPPLKHIKYNSPDDFEAIVKMISSQKPEALLVFCEPERSLELIRFLRSRQLELPVYTQLSLLQEGNFACMSRDHVEAVYFCDNGTWMSDTDSEFVQTFSREFGRYPGLMAAYAYDAIKILAQAIGNSGPDPQKLRESLSKTHYSGKTGAIEFDRFGNRKSTLKPGVVSSEILSASKP